LKVLEINLSNEKKLFKLEHQMKQEFISIRRQTLLLHVVTL